MSAELQQLTIQNALHAFQDALESTIERSSNHEPLKEPLEQLRLAALRHEVRSNLLADAFRTLLAKLDASGVPLETYWNWNDFERFVDHIVTNLYGVEAKS